MKNIINEKDLEFYYRHFFEKSFGVETVSIHNTDGYFEYKNTRVLIEIKFKVPFNKQNICRILAQAIYYCKKFAMKLDPIPSIIFIGNEKNFCFFESSFYDRYLLDNSIDWFIPPSKVFQSKTNALIKKIERDIDRIDVYEINEIDKFLQHVKSYSQKCSSKIIVSKDSFIDFFRKFNDTFKINDKKSLVELFFKKILEPDKIENIGKYVCINDKIYKNVPYKKFENFFSQYDISSIGKTDLVSYYDAMKKDESRIVTGSFYTPPYIARIAIEAMEKFIDKDFRKTYTVWDPACGTGNLTRYWDFENLYLSTNDKLELKLMEIAGVNPKATKFEYDFVSELDLNFIYKKEFKKLKKAVEKGNLIFYMNPPFVGFSGGGGYSFRDSRTKWNENPVYNALKKHKISVNNSTILFLYKIMRIAEKTRKNVYVCFFHDASLPVKISRQKFFRMFFKHFKHVYSLLFNSEDFGVTYGWEIQFSIFKYEYSSKQREVMFTGHKLFFNDLQDIKYAKKYIIKPIDEEFSSPSSRIAKCSFKHFSGYLPHDYLFSIPNYSDSSKIGIGNKNTIVTLDCYKVCPRNYWKSMIYCGVPNSFSSKYLSIRTKFARTTNLNIFDKKKFIEHLLDCAVMAVFDKSSLKPMRNSKEIKMKTDRKEIGWNGTFRCRPQGWDFINHMFPWSTRGVEKKAKKYGFKLVDNDCKLNYGNRYTYIKLKKFEKYLSKEAKYVLMRATRIYLTLLKDKNEEFFKDGFDNNKVRKYDENKILYGFLEKLGRKIYEDSQKFGTLA